MGDDPIRTWFDRGYHAFSRTFPDATATFGRALFYLRLIAQR